MPRLLPLALLIAALTPSALAQDLLPKAPPQTQSVIIINATVHPVSAPPIPNAYIAFDKGLITALGPIADRPTPNNTDSLVINAAGKHIYPGLIAPYSQLGLTEIAAVRATLDTGEVGQATPEVRAGVAVNPDSTLIPVARTGGVLLAGVFPLTGASGGLVPGRASVMKLDGWTTEEMAADMQAGLVLNWPLMRPITSRWMNKPRDEQLKDTERTLAAIDRLFADAAAYAAAVAADPSHPTDLRLDAMRPLFPPVAPPSEGAAPAGNGHAQKPVFIIANDYDQIAAAVAFADAHKLRPVIVGGMDAPLAAHLLKARDIPVIITGLIRFPKRADGAYDEPFTIPAKLKAAGVRFCLGSGEEAANERNLPFAAGMAVAHGLSKDEALRAITLGPAEVLGVADRYGALAPGKSATLIIAGGDILEITTHVEGAWIDGRKIDLSNKQTELEKKYREKYRQLNGQAR